MEIVQKQSSSAGTPPSPKSAGGGRKVGFANRTRPTLIIPPPPAAAGGGGGGGGGVSTRSSHQPFTAQSRYSERTPGSYYQRKQSVFNFDQLYSIKDLTKSGLGLGEKCAYWLYNKLKVWSQKWFTHFFLTIVLILYTIGGALVFEIIEGRNESAVEVDLRSLRNNLIRGLRNLSIVMPDATSVPEWEGEAVRRMKEYESEIIHWYTTHKLIVSNPDGKKWTFSNAIVYCGTIYTTIDSIYNNPHVVSDTNFVRSKYLKIKQSYTGMDILHTSTGQRTDENVEKNQQEASIRARIEALVTPEQVHSASVAKKRRSFTKKRVTKRDQTPLKELDDHTTISTDDELETAPKPRPKTPERRRRKCNLGNGTTRSKSESEFEEAKKQIETAKTAGGSFSKQIVDELKKSEKYADLAQAQAIIFFNKTKKNIAEVAARGRDRFNKKIDKEQLKRSQSAPYAFTEEELIASFQKAQLLDSFAKPNEIEFEEEEEEEAIPSKPIMKKTNEGIRQRRKSRPRSISKIIEIIDPKTSNIMATKASIAKPDFGLTHLINTLRVFTIRELIHNYQYFKVDMKDECRRIRKLKNRCLCELFLIMVYCGLGGFLFRFVEGSFENFYKCGVKRVKRDFIDSLWIKSHNLREDDWKSMARIRLRTFEEELHAAHEAGMKTYSGQRSWSFLNAVVFSLSIVTTIGYGHIYPETRTGKALTIVYAIIGIPLFLLALTDFGKLFTRCIKFLWSFVRRLYYTGSCRSVRKTAHVKEILHGAQMMYEIATFRRPSMFTDPENPDNPPDLSSAPTGDQIADDTPTTPAISNFEIDDEFNLPISLAIFILVLYILCGGLIYCVWEGWDFFDSFYFVFISMSTVGFGDMVPDDPACMIVSIVYLVFGLALTSMCINVVQVKLSNTFKDASSKIGATIGIDVAEEDGSITTIPVDKVEIPPIHENENKTSKIAYLSPNDIQFK